MAQLPRVAGSLSDATKLKFSNINSQLAEMKHLDVTPAGMAAFTAGWTEVDSGTNVNISAGVVTLNGNAAYGNNGMLSQAFTRAEGYFELKASFTASLANQLWMAITNLNALASGASVNQNGIVVTTGPVANSFFSASAASGSSPALSLSTYYTFRFYVTTFSDGSVRGVITTIQGGAYTLETELGRITYVGTALADPLYFFFQRNINNANLVSVKEFAWFSGYATDAPYVTYTHDAGAGKVFDNFDLTNLAMPGTVPSTNLTFKYSFDDGTPSYSSALTLANLNAVGKLTARHRYIRIQVLLNSDGTTQVYADKPNSDTATDGVGDFADVANVFSNDSIQLVTGTGTAPSAAKVMADAGNFGPGAATAPTLPLTSVRASSGGALPENRISPNTAVPGTQDLPALNKVAPSDTLEGATGTMDIPALNKVAPSDTLEGATGTMDIPTVNHLTANDTLEGVAGLIPLSDVMPASGGTSDKLYSAAEEVTRNNGLTAPKMLTGQSATQRGTLINGSGQGIQKQIQYISPSYGPPAGGTEVTIYAMSDTGVDFTDAKRVDFDGVEAEIVDNTNPSFVIATTPAGSEGATVQIDVTLSDDSVVSFIGFLYISTGGALTVPAKITGVTVTALSSTSQRVAWNMADPALGGPAAKYKIKRDGVELPGFYYDLKGDITGLTADTEYAYQVAGVNDAGTGEYSDAVTGSTLALQGIEHALWTTYKTKMQENAVLSNYVQKWKFNREANILSESKFPVFKSWIADINDEWKGVPKSKIAKIRVIIHTLVKSGSDVEGEKLRMDEYVRNAIEADMTFAGGVTMNILGPTIFTNLSDDVVQGFLEVEVLSNRFTAGSR